MFLCTRSLALYIARVTLAESLWDVGIGAALQWTLQQAVRNRRLLAYSHLPVRENEARRYRFGNHEV